MEHQLTQTKAGRARKPNGFTLFELVVAMGLSLGIMAAGIALYVNALKSSAVNQAQVSANSSARLVMGYIDKDLKQAIVIPCATGAAGCNAGNTVTISTPASAAGTYTPNDTTLVLQMPAWNSATSETITGIYDTVIYQYVAGTSNNTCNVRRIVSPGAGSTRIAEDRYLLPYESQTVTSNPATPKLSEPWLAPADGTTQIFRYFVQAKTSGVANGQTNVRNAEAWKDVVMVETRFKVVKTFFPNPDLKAEVVTRSRLRNWAP